MNKGQFFYRLERECVFIPLFPLPVPQHINTRAVARVLLTKWQCDGREGISHLRKRAESWHGVHLTLDLGHLSLKAPTVPCVKQGLEQVIFCRVGESIM